MLPCDTAPAVLLVDDSPTSRLAARGQLRPLGLRVLEAESGEEAVELLRAGKQAVALVVTDLEMGGMDGLALAQWVRGQGRLRSVPVVLLTAAPERVPPARVRDVVAVMTKPLLGGGFCAEVRRLLGVRAAPGPHRLPH